MALEIRNAKLPAGQTVTIRIDGGRITSIDSEAGWEPFIDAKGLTVLPGVVDGHVHLRYDQPDKEDLISFTRAAWLGGVTTACDMPNDAASLDRAELIDAKWFGTKELGITRRLWFGATPDNLGEIPQIAQDQRIVGVKMYMGSSTGSLLVTEEKDQRHICQLCAENHVLLAVHAEDEELMRQNSLLLGRQPLIAEHCLIRNTAVEASAVARILRLAKETGCDLHLCHISTPEALELAYDAKARGVRVTTGVCPHHLFLDDRCLQKRIGAGDYKMNPALRTPAQVERMRTLLCRPGYVDLIESDHAPHVRAEKRLKDYRRVPSGVPGVQTILPLMMTFVRFFRQYCLTLERLIELVSAAPAARFGLPSKGVLKVGFDADLVLVNPSRSVTLKNDDMATKWRWTPFHNMVAYGAPQMVVSGGEIVLNNLTNSPA